MATSGSLNTNFLDAFYITFNWNLISQDYSANTSLISWNITAHNSSRKV